MSLNKNALIRYRELDKCFSNRNRKFFIEDLLIAVNDALYEFNGSDNGINRRQLFDDIRYMVSDQGWSIPLERHREGKRVFYRYFDLNFSITKQVITHDEKKHFQSALSVLKHFSGTAQFEWLQEILPAIESKLDIESGGDEIIELQSNIDLKGLSFLNELYNAILQKHVLTINYQDFKSDKSDRIIFHPYYLKQYNNRWFVLGHNEEKDVSTWIMALDRIQKLEYHSSVYITNSTDWKEYFFDIIGVTKSNDQLPEIIKLEVSDSSRPYVLTKPLHPTQKVLQKKPSLVIQIEVIPNFELLSTILSFGSNMKVISPESLRMKIVDEIKLLNQKYKIL